jgi:phosphoribosylanthranilate isomerase
MTRVKICGITNLRDARAAVEAGADALGFIFFPRSSRFISWREAGAIIAELPPFVARVGVFVDADVGTIRQAIAESGINHVQLHGEEPPGFGEELRLPIIKAFRIADESSLKPLERYPAEAFLLDSFTPGQHGGTGATFNWELAVKAKGTGKPIILAGGLTPENVAEAVQKVRPYAVDVASGVEAKPGQKDQDKVRRFISAAKSVTI